MTKLLLRNSIHFKRTVISKIIFKDTDGVYISKEAIKKI